MKTVHNAITIAASVFIAVATPASAQDAPRRVVHYGDLDLHTTAGVHMLHNRLEGALAGVCGDRFEQDLARRRHVNICRATAMREVSPQIAAAVARGRQLASTQTTGSLPR